ncbi:hypothetical protein [Stackebrandtia soli]|uniref:hypothetical protein n=1 Tax=Stackebrandtia soli TaxID=1892856 RepID=UPI0039E9BDA9
MLFMAPFATVAVLVAAFGWNRITGGLAALASLIAAGFVASTSGVYGAAPLIVLCGLGSLALAGAIADVPEAVRRHRFGDKTARVIVAAASLWIGVAVTAVGAPEKFGRAGWVVVLAQPLLAAVLVAAGRTRAARRTALTLVASGLTGGLVWSCATLFGDDGSVLGALTWMGLLCTSCLIAPFGVDAVHRYAAPIMALLLVAVPPLTVLAWSGLSTTPMMPMWIAVLVVAVGTAQLLLAPGAATTAAGWPTLAVGLSGLGERAAFHELGALVVPMAVVAAAFALSWVAARAESIVGSTRFDTMPPLRSRAPRLAAVLIVGTALNVMWLLWIIVGAVVGGVAVALVGAPVVVLAAWRSLRAVTAGGRAVLVAGETAVVSGGIWPTLALIASVGIVVGGLSAGVQAI